jgi:phosphoglycolate phosphatase
MVNSQGILTDRLRSAAVDKRLLVLDYDGTLAYLAIDWQAVRRDLSRSAALLGFRSQFRPLWDEISRFRDEYGLSEVHQLFRVLARHEEIGVDGQQPRTAVVDAVRALLRHVPLDAAVFSSNLHRTVGTGLSKLRLESISAIVGADDVPHWKPEPHGLQELLTRARVGPDAALFVGDSENDATAAAALGVDFVRV